MLLTLAVLIAPPYPVEKPRLTKNAFSRGAAASVILATDFIHYCVFREGACIPKVVYWFSLAGKSTGTIRHQVGFSLSFIDKNKQKHLFGIRKFDSLESELILQKKFVKTYLNLYKIVWELRQEVHSPLW